MGAIRSSSVRYLEAPRRPSQLELAALDASISLDVAGPAMVACRFSKLARLKRFTSHSSGELPKELHRSPIWTLVTSGQDDTAKVVRVGGPDVVFTFRIKGSQKSLIQAEPSPVRVIPGANELERAQTVSDAVLRVGGLLRRNDTNGKWTHYTLDDTPIVRAFEDICSPRTIKSYSAACRTEDGGALIEIGTPTHLFAFSRQRADKPLVWHRVLMR